MFKMVIRNFRKRETDSYIDSDGDDIEEKFPNSVYFSETACSCFSEDDLAVLQDYIVFGENDSGRANVRLLEKIEKICGEQISMILKCTG
jgi:hypothetical protein